MSPCGDLNCETDGTDKAYKKAKIILARFHNGKYWRTMRPVRMK